MNKSYLILLLAGVFLYSTSTAQQPYVRIAKIVVDSGQLESYKAFLAEGIETAVRVEPGVLRMYAVQDKLKPTHVTVFETYASKDAYDFHVQTSHFKKYKSGTLSMVKSLELVDVDPIIFKAKPER